MLITAAHCTDGVRGKVLVNFDPVAPAAPMAVRHSFASLLAREGRSAVYIAAQLGHGPDLSIRVYQHVISEFEDAPRLGAEDAIRQARNKGARKLG